MTLLLDNTTTSILLTCGVPKLIFFFRICLNFLFRPLYIASTSSMYLHSEIKLSTVGQWLPPDNSHTHTQGHKH
ncbi:hypothetical protein C0J52_03468 [Blattella germanica]|nr:hypothetical protein C0J52_03468 [Blattella germanica]